VSNNWTGAKMFFDWSLVEARFLRRIKKGDGYKATRRMLCTSNFFYAKALSIAMGKPLPKVKDRRGKSWYRSRKLLLVYDILESEYRMVNLDPPNFIVIDYIPFRTKNLHNIGKFMQTQGVKSLAKSTKRTYHNK